MLDSPDQREPRVGNNEHGPKRNHPMDGTAMDDTLVQEGAGENRTARMSVLAWHPKAEDLAICSPYPPPPADGVGPWSGEPDRIWRTTEFPPATQSKPGEIRLHQLDAPLEHCVELARRILCGNVLAIDDVEVCYDLEPRPRSHWAYRNHMGTDGHSVNSPFSRHSAKVTEFWSFAPEPRDQWRRICESYVPLSWRVMCAAWVFVLTSDWTGSEI